MSAIVARFSTRQIVGAVLVVLAIGAGVGVALASSPGSLTSAGRQGIGQRASGARSGSATPTSSASPVTTPQQGVLGSNPTLQATASGGLLASGGSGRTYLSLDGGAEWSAVAVPSPAVPVLADPAEPHHLIAGGSTVEVSSDAGATWQTVSSPPAPAQYKPLAISPSDANVWFFVHGGRLLRTRDGGASWRDIPTANPLAAPVMVAASTAGRFYLADSNHLFQLDNNGEQIHALSGLGQGVAVLELAYAGGDGTPALVARASDGNSYKFSGSAWRVSGAALAGPVAANASGSMFVADGGQTAGAAGSVAYSTDGGLNWHVGAGLPTDQSIDALSADSSRTVYAYSFAGDLWSSSDGGATWALISSRLRRV